MPPAPPPPLTPPEFFSFLRVCIEIDLERSYLTLKKLSQIIQREFELSEDISFVTTKRPDVRIRNDKEVKKLKSEDEIELIQVDAPH